MRIMDKPYVSELLIESMANFDIPVLKNSVSKEKAKTSNINLVEDEHFKAKYNGDALLYTNSENAIGWICDNLGEYNIVEKINMLKDKAEFRRIIKGIYPDFFFNEVSQRELDGIDIETMKKPFIIKPAVGFFSMGVYRISNNADWTIAKEEIKQSMEEVETLYPKQVIDGTRFIIEEYIEGEEFAIDAYYNAEGEAVVLNILKHDFSSEADVSDRVYYTSKEIIEENLDRFSDLLNQLNQTLNLKNFPMHIEVRANGNAIVPIEINPMRFAGWCTTDIAHFAYGVNVYKYYFEKQKPDWEMILKDKAEKLYSIIVLDMPKA